MLANHYVLLLLVAGSTVITTSVLSLPQQDADVSNTEKKFGDKCEVNEDCNFNGSMCTMDRSNKKATCQCRPELAVTNHINKCGNKAAINEACFFNEQCEASVFQTECRDDICVCRFERTPVLNNEGITECIAKNYSNSEPYTDPAMLCVLGGMCLMFIIICVVLRLFSKARWRENRTIFNTPNPRLMNVSLLRDNKPPPGASGERRGSKSSTKTHSPSRQPSMASLKPQSPSLGRVLNRGNNGSESIKSPTTKTAISLTQAELKSSEVTVDIQQE
ncbi:uncharacterized protein LOC126905104 [Daktulosphaira vitifoliae]|uniref:uncharacterized protein LOC126905104 n=1 Tax=Daktulosphaira vitifoliae TaxID=58002 RepID=UPI0021AA252E|nr:uncharacterized protein LOC126905104 [Daktulosphaira vitifoliae]